MNDPPEDSECVDDGGDSTLGNNGNGGNGGIGSFRGEGTNGDEDEGAGESSLSLLAGLFFGILRLLARNLALFLHVYLFCWWTLRATTAKQRRSFFRQPALRGIIIAIATFLPFLSNLKAKLDEDENEDIRQKFYQRRRGRYRNRTSSDHYWDKFYSSSDSDDYQDFVEERMKYYFKSRLHPDFDDQFEYEAYEDRQNDYYKSEKKYSTTAKSNSVPLAKAKVQSFKSYRDSWDSLLIGNKTIKFSDIPWPPVDNPLLLEAGDSNLVAKRKMKMALLIWHPDKFASSIGSRLHDQERRRIETEADKVVQRILELKSSMKL